jgi:uncharacterized phage protein gp47/JayE
VPYPRQTLTALRASAMQDITASDLPNADGFLRRAVLRVVAWVLAGFAYLHDGYLDWISLQSTPFTATGEYMEGWAALAPTPVLREAPTFASGLASWPGVSGAPLPAGTICNRSDGVQYATVASATAGGGSVAVTIVALVAGTDGNMDSGAPLTLAGAIDGINLDGTATGPITGGADLELDGPLRTRMLQSYGAPPHGGNQADYVTWAMQVPGVTRVWCNPSGAGAGTVAVFFMMDAAEASHGGFPQGTDGVAALESRGMTATGDQLAVADHIYPLRPVTVIVYAMAPLPQMTDFTFAGLSGISPAQQILVSAALTDLFLRKDTPLNDTSIQQSDCEAAVSAIGGLPSFAITIPSSWPITSLAAHIFTLGTVTYT